MNYGSIIIKYKSAFTNSHPTYMYAILSLFQLPFINKLNKISENVSWLYSCNAVIWEISIWHHSIQKSILQRFQGTILSLWVGDLREGLVVFQIHYCVSQTGVGEQSGNYLTSSSAFGSLTPFISTLGWRHFPLHMLFPCWIMVFSKYRA